MRIRECTPERLVIEDRPVILAILLSVLLMAFAGGMLFFLRQGDWFATGLAGFGAFLMTGILTASVRRVIVVLDRPAGVVLIRSRTVFGQTEDRRALSTLLGAEAEGKRSGRGGMSYRPALRFADGTLPLCDVHVPGRGAAEIAEAVERWLRPAP